MSYSTSNKIKLLQSASALILGATAVGKTDLSLDLAEIIDGADVHLSLSHDAGIASAMVIVERN